MALVRLSSPFRVVSHHRTATTIKSFTPFHIRDRQAGPGFGPANSKTLSLRPASTLAVEPSSSSPPPFSSLKRFAQRLRAPTAEDLEAVELDPALAEEANDSNLDITMHAAEQLRKISMRENDSNIALRVAVESGGCHGYQYKMELTSQHEPDDYLFQHASLTPSNVVVDATSMGLLKGSTLDFATELIGSSFRVIDNPQAKGSGCGCGVSWEAKT